MKNLLRFTSALTGGVAVAGSLILLMQWILNNEAGAIQADRDTTVLEFVRLKRDSDIRIRERRKLDKEPPPQELIQPSKPKIKIASVQPHITTPKFELIPMNLAIASKTPYIGPVRQGPPDRSFMAISRMPPQYPYRAERKGIEGWVKVSFLITEKGRVADIVLLDSKPKQIFDHAAIRAVQKWRFKPQIKEGKPTPVRAEQVVNFRLQRGKV